MPTYRVILYPDLFSQDFIAEDDESAKTKAERYKNRAAIEGFELIEARTICDYTNPTWDGRKRKISYL
jgi:hypothetical protein